MRGLLIAAALFLVPAAASAQLRVVATVDGQPRAAPVQARVGERVELRVVQRTGTPLPEGSTVRWMRVQPVMQHRDTPPPNEGIAQYSNSVLFGPRHGRWIGLDTVEYESAPLPASGPVLVLDAARSREHGGAGSIWIAAEAQLPDGTVMHTPDATDTDRLGLRSRVLRVSFRASDDFLGWLGTYFHVPNIFGSIGAQADRYVGADCADVLVGALRASGRRGLRYTSVGGIGRYATPVSEALFLQDGVVRDDTGAAVELRWGEHVRPGDLLAIDYLPRGSAPDMMPRAWDHIGALVSDRRGRGEEGVLDGLDVLRHMTPRGLLDLPIHSEGRIRFRVWRWRAAAR